MTGQTVAQAQGSTATDRRRFGAGTRSRRKCDQPRNAENTMAQQYQRGMSVAKPPFTVTG